MLGWNSLKCWMWARMSALYSGCLMYRPLLVIHSSFIHSFIYVFIFIWDRVLPCSVGCPRPHYVSWTWASYTPFPSVPQILGLLAYATVSSSNAILKDLNAWHNPLFCLGITNLPLLGAGYFSCSCDFAKLSLAFTALGTAVAWCANSLPSVGFSPLVFWWLLAWSVFLRLWVCYI